MFGCSKLLYALLSDRFSDLFSGLLSVRVLEVTGDTLLLLPASVSGVNLEFESVDIALDFRSAV